MSRIVQWFVGNPIAANLMMILIVIGGLLSFPGMDKQFFPYSDPNQINVTVAYPGASPAEVERQICIRLEDSVHDLDGIDELRCTASESFGQLAIKVEEGYDSQRLLNDVKGRVDSINTFPTEAERPLVAEQLWKDQMISVSLAGDIGEVNLKELGEQLRDEMASLPHVSLVELKQPRDYELSIEVSEVDLRRYGLRFDDVVKAVRNSSLNLPAGKIRAEAGDIQLQTRAQGYVASDFEELVLRSKIDGTRISLADVATVRDGFVDQDVDVRFNDMPSLSLDVYVTTRPDVLKTTESVRSYVEDVQSRLPPGVEMVVWRDMSIPFQDRISTLISNGVGGLILVYIVLVLFLRPMLAFWVCVGIAVAFLGTFWLLPMTGVSFNMLSMFAFLMILGIVVDDAIIVGESVHARQEMGIEQHMGAATGAQMVLKPVLFAVISTMIFFIPMFFLDGDAAAHMISIPVVVILALMFSLIESLLILPSHLAHMGPERSGKIEWLKPLSRWRERFAQGMVRFAAERYRPFLERSMRNYRLTVAMFTVVLMFSLSIVMGGWVKVAFFPVIPMDFMIATVKMPEGTPFHETQSVLKRVDGGVDAMREAGGSEMVTHVQAMAYDNTARVIVGLQEGDRKVSNTDLVNIWKSATGELANADDFDIYYTIMPTGKALEFQLAANDIATLRSATAELRKELARYPGVFNIRDSLDSPTSEIELALKPKAENLNLTLSDLARQVRRGFYGEEVQRIPRLREDVKVMVRYPEAERRSEDSLREMRIRTPDGREVPFEQVAEVRYVPSYQTIERFDRKRIVDITAELEPGYSSASEIAAAVQSSLEQWKYRYPGLKPSVEGEQREMNEFVIGLVQMIGLSILTIFGLMAIAFHSYWQPLLILSAIPFGIMGAIFGHIIMGVDIAMMSMMGILACAGVVVNDNLVLIDRVNRLREQGYELWDALLQGGQDRFRPIILTSLTTFIGLLPIMSETSMQAQFLIPMVISLAFGVLFATGVTLLFVPCLYLFGERQKLKLKREQALPEQQA